MTNNDFIVLIWEKAAELYRDMPWREDTRPYYVLVSELMLQQTQVDRVIPKFDAFIAAFPNEQLLAEATLGEVLKLWQGLGYNRRAKYLHESAKMVIEDFGGIFPCEQSELIKLPGVGNNTAGAIAAYAFNRPEIFVETNVRTVYIHHFFRHQSAVSDREILKLVEKTVDYEHPREFYWALMDYGAWLKSQGIRNTSASKHYQKQSKLKGSIRETRGRIISALTKAEYTTSELKKAVAMDDRFASALSGLLNDGLIQQTADKLHLTK